MKGYTNFTKVHAEVGEFDNLEFNDVTVESFTGNVTGNLTGNVTGNVTGDVDAEAITTDTFALNTKITAIADIDAESTPAEIATAVNSLIAALVSAGILEAE